MSDTTASLRDALTMIGYSQRSFAQHLQVSENTVSRWCRTDNAPHEVEVYVGLLIQLKNTETPADLQSLKNEWLPA